MLSKQFCLLNFSLRRPDDCESVYSGTKSLCNERQGVVKQFLHDDSDLDDDSDDSHDHCDHVHHDIVDDHDDDDNDGDGDDNDDDNNDVDDDDTT